MELVKFIATAALCAAVLCSCSAEQEFIEDDVRFADGIMRSLSSDAYRAAPGTNCGYLLRHSVSSIPHGQNIDKP